MILFGELPIVVKEKGKREKQKKKTGLNGKKGKVLKSTERVSNHCISNYILA